MLCETYEVLDNSKECLNPCFNGICSASTVYSGPDVLRSLNPCFNGICSAREFTVEESREYWEICLNPCFNGICSASSLMGTTMFSSVRS